MPPPADVALSRIRVVALLAVLGAGLLGARGLWIQSSRDPRLERMAQRQFRAKFLLKPRRGAILDRSGEPLAISVESQSLAVNPRRARRPRLLARLLARATETPEAALLARLRGGKDFAWVKRHLTDEDMDRLRRTGLMSDEGDLAEALYLVKESRRRYPHGRLAGQLLGSVDVDGEGIEGVERWRNERLKGDVVTVRAVRDALGRPAFMDASAAQDLKEGETVRLTIDASLQFAVEEELEAAARSTQSRAGAAIVLGARSGDLLAVASWPFFSPGDARSDPEARRARALTDTYEPGSVIKPLIVAAALAKGMRGTDSIWGERGRWKVQGHAITEAEAHEKFEWITLERLLARSSNIGAAKLALQLGGPRVAGALRAFGFGSRSGTGFPGEVAGRLPTRWPPLTVANVGFGQGFLATPLQVARSLAPVANGGGYLPDVRLLLPEDGDAPRPDRRERLISERVQRELTGALLRVTEGEGTGVKAAMAGLRVAGKTGTAQVVDPATRRYSRTRYFSSFVGFPVFPAAARASIAEDYVIYVALDGPQGEYYASETAAPLFRRILEGLVRRYGLPTETAPQPILATTHPAFGPALTPAVERRLTWGAGARASMPELRGLTAREALRLLNAEGFRPRVQGAGIVREQTPAPGEKIARGAAVELRLGEAP